MTDDEWRIECRARIAAWRASDHVHCAVGRDKGDSTINPNKRKARAFASWTETVTAARREEWDRHWRQVDAELKRGKREKMDFTEKEREDVELEIESEEL